MDELAKHIERTLKEREFCLVFEDELERWWPAKRWIQRNERNRFKLSPNHMGGALLFSIRILVLSGHYSHVDEKTLAQRMARVNSRRIQGQRQKSPLLCHVPDLLVSYDVEILSSDASAGDVGRGKGCFSRRRCSPGRVD